jgi:Skp family chaperone for outer membrane proteins
MWNFFLKGKIMKKSFWILLTAAGAMIATLSLKPSIAQDKPAAPTTAPAAAEAQPARIAVCDLLTLLKNYDRGNDSKKELNARMVRIKAEADKRGEEIKKIEASLEDLKTGSKEYDAQLNKMTELAINQQAYVNFQDEMAKRDTYRYTKEIYQEVLDGVEKVAKEKGYQLVLFKSPNLVTQKYDELLEQIARRKVLYSDPALDITDDVLKRINRDYALRKK